jgi:Lrp/AsnC family transcriptional regulator for asnA, asnC and gidA
MVARIDTIDRAIVKLLITDGRMPATEIARRIAGVSDQSVHYRIKRLLQQDVIRVSAIVDPRAIGYAVRADAFINVKPGCVSALAQRLTTFEEISYVACSFGNYDISITVHAHDNTELYAFVSETLANVPGIIEITTVLVPIFLKDVNLWHLPDSEPKAPSTLPTQTTLPRPSQITTRRIDQVDQAIVHLLIQDGRMPGTEIARRVGDIPPRSVRDRIQALIEHGVIRVSAIVDPETVGFSVRADVFVEVESKHLLEVAQRLAQLEETSYVACSIGGPDLSIQIYARDNKELYRFVTQVIHEIPGVTRTVTTLVPLVLKDVYDWRIPDSVCIDADE